MRELDEKIGAMQAMRDTLAHLAEHCHGDQRPDCPILEDLAADHADDASHCKPATRVASRRPGTLRQRP
jgi:hypothetical protein